MKERELMKNFWKICLSSIVISTIECFAELVLMILESEITGLTMVTFVIVPALIVILGHCFYLICRKKQWLSTLQRGIALLCSDVIYIIMMMTVFLACCYYLGIGADYSEGFFVVSVWYVSIAVSVVHFFIVLAVIICQQIRVAAGYKKHEGE